jgi:hypothetical protein
MIVEGLATVAAVNPEPKNGKRKMAVSMPAPAKSAGARYKQAWTSLPQQGIAVLALTFGNLLSNLFRTQAIARLPIENAAGLHGIDFAAQNLIIAPLEALIPGEFGQTMMLATRFNSVNAAARAIVPPKYPAVKMLFGVDEFISRQAVEEMIAAADGTEAPAGAGAMATPGSRYRKTVSAMATPGSRYRQTA